MKVLVDMNVSPLLVPELAAAGHEAVHWFDVGAPAAPDRELMVWAERHGMVLVTHDLDFGAMLGSSNEAGPSVIQVRAARLPVRELASLLVQTLGDCKEQLLSGALVTIDVSKRRVRMLPMRTDP